MVTVDHVRQVTFLQRASACTDKLHDSNLTLEAMEAVRKKRQFWLRRAKEIENKCSTAHDAKKK